MTRVVRLIGAYGLGSYQSNSVQPPALHDRAAMLAAVAPALRCAGGAARWGLRRFAASATAAPTLARSVLYVPADNGKALAKAGSLQCDVLLLDLEDGCRDKSRGRANAMAALADGTLGAARVVLRINGTGTPFIADDTDALRTTPGALPRLHAVALPKAQSFAQLASLAIMLGGNQVRSATKRDDDTRPLLRMWPVIETPSGVLGCRQLCADAALVAAAGGAPDDGTQCEELLELVERGGGPRGRRLRQIGEQLRFRVQVEALVAGTSDLTKELRARSTPDRAPMLPALSQLLLCARAHGMLAVDGVFLDLRPESAPLFEAHCQQGRALGFDGKSLIHPSQVGPANAVFAPSEAEVARAQAIMRAVREAEAKAQAQAAPGAGSGQGKGVLLVVDGQLVEGLHVAEAARTLALHAAIAARGSGGGAAMAAALGPAAALAAAGNGGNAQ